MIERLKAQTVQAGVSDLKLYRVMRSIIIFHQIVLMCAMLGKILDREGAIWECYMELRPRRRLTTTEIFPDPRYQFLTVQRLVVATGFQLRVTNGFWFLLTKNF